MDSLYKGRPNLLLTLYIIMFPILLTLDVNRDLVAVVYTITFFLLTILTITLYVETSNRFLVIGKRVYSDSDMRFFVTFRKGSLVIYHDRLFYYKLVQSGFYSQDNINLDEIKSYIDDNINSYVNKNYKEREKRREHIKQMNKIKDWDGILNIQVERDKKIKNIL